MPESELIVGIDLGTTNSLVAVFEHGAPRVIPDDQGRALLPSVVRFDPAGPVVGHDARSGAVEFPTRTVASVKRLMGRSLRDAQPDLAHLSYPVVAGENDTARVRINLPTGEERVYSPPEVSAIILRELRARAERALRRVVRRAVITVPAYFDDAQRQATRDAGRLAGLEVVRIINEPTAAALAYGIGLRGIALPGDGSALGASGDSTRSTIGQKADATATVAVFDLGGGTFDVSILRLLPGGSGQETGPDQTGLETGLHHTGLQTGPTQEITPTIFQVLSTAGDTHLGGDDLDILLAETFRKEIEHQMRLGGAVDELAPSAKQALRDAAEAAKCRLSDAETTEVSVRAEHVEFHRRLTRAELEALIEPWVQRAMKICDRALRDARTAAGGQLNITAVVMVGGSTRIPLVRRRVAEFFGLEPYTALDPDQVVALGAAVQAGVLSGGAADALLLDVIPLSLGVETVGGAVAKIIMRNSTVPARAVERFSTSVDGQTSIRFTVYQGEREMAEDCRKLAEFHLRGLPPMPAGIPQLEVEFLVDVNGVLNVAAVEKRSGKRAALQVVPNHGLTREEVDRIERESIANAREDMTRHRVADLIVNARMDAKWIGEGLARHGAALDPAYAADLSAKRDRLLSMAAAAEADWRSSDPDEFHRLKEDLDRASVRLQEVAIMESLKGERARA